MTPITVASLRALLTIEDRSAAGVSSFERNLRAVEQRAEALSASLVKHGAVLSAGITLPIMAMGKAVLQAGTDFIQTMNKVSAVTNATPAQFERLKQAAIEWGAKTQYSATEAAEAMLELGKAGFTTEQSISALPSTLQLAAAANMSLGDAANLTANVMKTYGLSVGDLGHANDILAAAANASTIEVTDLREAIKYVGPVAAQTGVGLSQSAAAMALMGEAGIKGSCSGSQQRSQPAAT